MAKEPEPKEKPPKQLPWGPEPRPEQIPVVRCSTCGGILPNCNCKPR